MSDGNRKVEFFALSTCGWCRKTKSWLDDHRVNYNIVYVDLAAEAEKTAAKERILQFVSRLSFPVIVVDDGREVIQGYQPDRFEEILK